MSDAIVVAGAGVCCLDYTVIAPTVEWGGSAVVSGCQVQGGGLVGTAMVACARLGALCKFYSLLGDDQVGEQITAELLAENVPVDGVVRLSGGSSPFSFIHVDEKTGERTIFYRPGVALDAGAGLLDLSALGTAQAVPIDDVYPVLSAAVARAAKSTDITVLADLMPGQGNAEILRDVDILIAPRDFVVNNGLQDDLAAALERIHWFGPTTAVITLGSKGAIFSDKSGVGRCKSFEVEVLDTTGAGDAFHGAFTYGVASGWDTARCAEFASAVAAINCTRPGGRTGLPTLPQVEEFLEAER